MDSGLQHAIPHRRLKSHILTYISLQLLFPFAINTCLRIHLANQPRRDDVLTKKTAGYEVGALLSEGYGVGALLSGLACVPGLSLSFGTVESDSAGCLHCPYRRFCVFRRRNPEQYVK
jgi:hypothetical protein